MGGLLAIAVILAAGWLAARLHLEDPECRCC